MSIPMIEEYEGVKYYCLHEEDTLKDQVIELLELADQNYEDRFKGDVPLHPAEESYIFNLIDAIKILTAAIERFDNEKKQQ